MWESKISLAIEQVPVISWEKLAQKKIYFAHQSVGYNILEGVSDITKDHPQIQLNIKEHDVPSMLLNPGLEHFKIGTNGDPISKINDYYKIINKKVGSRTEIAIFKFCYLDITANTDIQAVFNHYKISMAKLRREYPKVQFVHMTVPLKTVQRGIKAYIKKMLGKNNGGSLDNVTRNQFNDLIKREYAGKEPLFDIAGIESLTSEDSHEIFYSNGILYNSLSPEFTDDGGHLNAIGRKVIAANLLIYLANLSTGSVYQ